MSSERTDRRDVFREIRRQVMSQNPGRDLRTLLQDILVPVVGGTEAVAGAVSMRFHESTRILAILVDAEGRTLFGVRPILDSPSETDAPPEPRETSGFVDPAIVRFGERLQLRPERVCVIPMLTDTGHVATLELADPDRGLVPRASSFLEDLPEIAVSFELAFLHARLRREQLEGRLLQRVSGELGRAVDLPTLLNSILDLLRQVVPFDAAAIFVVEGKGDLEVRHQAVRGYTDVEKRGLHLKVGEGLVGWVAKTGEAQIVPEVDRDPRYVDVRHSTRSEMVGPLNSGGRLVGVFNLESDDANKYTPHDLRLLATFGEQAAVALERAALLAEQEAKRRIEQELSIARRIQRFFLPRITPSLARRGLAGKTVPSLEVSGDYYDFLERTDGSVVVAVADVSGKGIPAALIMSSLQAAFRLAATRGDDPADWCRDLNQLLFRSLRDTEFVTAVFGILSPDRRRFVFCNAGHNPPLVLRESGEVEWLSTGGTILGAFADTKYARKEIALAPGDIAVLYTDGVTEAFSPGGEQFGEERLVESVRASRGGDATERCLALVREVRRYVNGPLPDDLTVAWITGPDPS